MADKPTLVFCPVNVREILSCPGFTGPSLRGFPAMTLPMLADHWPGAASMDAADQGEDKTRR